MTNSYRYPVQPKTGENLFAAAVLAGCLYGLRKLNERDKQRVK